MRVIVRIRPLQEHETGSQCVVPSGNDCIQLLSPLPNELVRVSRVYTPSCSQISIFEEALFPTVADVINGGSGTVIAYGQTGSGKRFSIEGTPQHPEHAQDEEIEVSVSWFEIYNESIQDLFISNTRERESDFMIKDKGKGLVVDGLNTYQVSSPEEVFELINNVQLDYERQSHTVFSVYVHNKSINKEGCLNFVVMIGSEQPQASLNNFRSIIDSLHKRLPQIPYHKSKLTLILKESLVSANTSTTLICTVSPARESTFDTSATLALAVQAMQINTKAKVLPIPQWSFRPKYRVDSGNHNNNNNDDISSNGQNNDNQDNEDSMSDYNNEYDNDNAIEDTLSEQNEQDYSTNTIGNGNLSINHYPATNSHTFPHQQHQHVKKQQQYNGNGTDAKSKLRIIKEGSSRNLAGKTIDKQRGNHYLTPRSPATPTNYSSGGSTPSSSPPFKFALTTSPPTPHKEKGPSAHDPTVEVQKLRMQLQKALQEINGFKIYKDVIDKNLMSLRDSLNNATDAKLLCEKELKSKELQIKKKNKEIEALNRTVKEATMAADRAAKDRATMKLRLDEIESMEADRIKMIEDAQEEVVRQTREREELEKDLTDQLDSLREDNLQIMDVCSRAQQDLEDKEKEISVLTEEVLRLTQLNEEGNTLRDEIESLKIKIKELQETVEQKDLHAQQMTQNHAASEKMAVRDSRTATIMAEATIAQLRKQISDLQIENQSLRSSNKPDTRKDTTQARISSASPSSSSQLTSSTNPSLSSSGRSATSILLSAITSSHSSSPTPSNPPTSVLSTPPRPSSPTTPSPHSTPSLSSSISTILSTLPSRPSSQTWSTPQPSSFTSSILQNIATPLPYIPFHHEDSYPQTPSTLIPTPNKEQIYLPIPSTPTTLTNPLLDTSKDNRKLNIPTSSSLSNSRSPPNSPGSFSTSPHNNSSPFLNPSLPPPPPPITPRTILSIQQQSAPPPPPILSNPSLSQTPQSFPLPPLSARDTNWAEYLQTLLPAHSEEIQNSHKHPPPFNMSQVQSTIENVRKLVNKPPT